VKGDAYWAAMPNSDDVVREFQARQARYRTWLDETRATRRALRSLRAYYGFGPNGTGDSTELGASGERGEFVEMAVNEYGGLVEQAYAQLVATKPGFQAVPKSGDYASRAQAAFADKLLTTVDTDNHLEEKEDEATKVGLLCREGWIALSWDKNAGDSIGVDGQKVVHDGDVRADVLLMWDVCFDVHSRHKTDLQWIAFRRPYNRWDLVAACQPTEADMADPVASERKSKLAEALKGINVSRNQNDFPDVHGMLFGNDSADVTDLLDVWEIRHIPTPALPQGRLIRFVDASTIISDSAAEGAGYPYKGLHCEYFEPAKVVGTAAGHSLAWDLLGMQEAVDSVATAMATAGHASGISNIWVQALGNGGEPSNLSVSSLGSGMRLVQSPTKPEALHAVQVDPQAVAFLEACRGWMQRRMGLNDVALGDASKGMPAQLAALLDAKVVQFWNQAVKSLSVMRARLRTGVLQMYQAFAKTPRVAALAGKGEALEMMEWTRDRLSSVSKVTVDEVSAVSKTLAGKMATADLLLERGLINTPDEYLAVKSTGRIEKLTEFKDRNLLRLQQEKEMLQRGIGLPPVDAMATEQAMMVDPEALPVFDSQAEGEFIRPTIVDTPWLDIAEYAAVLASPEARNRPDVVQAATDAIQFKVLMWRTMPSEIIAALGGMPPPPPGGEMMPPESMGEDTPPPGSEMDMRPIEPPKPPANPITGEQAEAASDVTQPV
jgi:hypothetical protein